MIYYIFSNFLERQYQLEQDGGSMVGIWKYIIDFYMSAYTFFHVILPHGLTVQLR